MIMGGTGAEWIEGIQCKKCHLRKGCKLRSGRVEKGINSHLGQGTKLQAEHSKLSPYTPCVAVTCATA